METVLLTLDPLPAGSGPALRARLAALLAARPDAGTVLCDVSALARPTPADLDHLAHLRLTCLRAGRVLLLHGPTRRLTLLLELAGLVQAFTPEPKTSP